MKSWLLLLTLGAIALAAWVTPAFSEEARTLTARWVLDVERGAAIENGIIIVKGERIAAVGRKGEFAPEGVGALALTRLTSNLLFGVGGHRPRHFRGDFNSFDLRRLTRQLHPRAPRGQARPDESARPRTMKNPIVGRLCQTPRLNGVSQKRPAISLSCRNQPDGDIEPLQQLPIR